MQQRRDFLKHAATPLALAALSPLQAWAQNTSLPLEQVKIVNGFPAGGTADVTSRRIGDKLAGSAYSRGPGVVENKTGAAGRIAVEAVKNAAPDGATLLLTPYSMMSIYPHIYSKLSYDPFKDFVPVCLASMLAHGLAVGPMVPASVIPVNDYPAWARSNPKGSLSYTSESSDYKGGVLTCVTVQTINKVRYEQHTTAIDLHTKH